jgi:hypothetical protein
MHMTKQERINPMNHAKAPVSAHLRQAFPIPPTGQFEDLLSAIDAAESGKQGSAGAAQASRSP